jgi:hypothetical protein
MIWIPKWTIKMTMMMKLGRISVTQGRNERQGYSMTTLLGAIRQIDEIAQRPLTA